MPRNASGTYTQPGGTTAVSGQTISSSAFNTLETDIGSEITNSVDRLGRGGMQANLPMNGFRATGAADPASAQDYTTLNYLTVTYTPSNPKIVAGLGFTPANKAGDTFTGNVTISNGAGTAQFTLAKSSSGNYSQIFGQTGGSARWSAILGDNVAEGGGNAGSNFQINRYDDSGTLIETAFSITRSTGAATFTRALTVSGAATFSSTAAFSSTTTAPTVTASDNSTNVATTAFVNAWAAQANGGAIGTYLVAGYSGGALLTVGSTVAGSTLSSGGLNGGAAYNPAGGTTWLYLGAVGVGTTGLFKRTA